MSSEMEERLKNYIEQNQTKTAIQESNPIARFVHHHVLELARDCLEKAQNKLVTRAYSIELTNKLQKLLTDAKEREEFAYYAIYPLVKKLKVLLIISRAVRLLESQKSDPEQSEVTEGQAKQTIKADISHDIISKLEQNGAPFTDDLDDAKDCDKNDAPEVEEYMLRQNVPKVRKPCEEDFETIKLISNGAYAAVYLVRHKENGQRFAMKKICKQKVIEKKQTEQVFTERDLLTFTDNPFVVGMYCSFNAKKHLCMVMEYVEGGDCATLVKSMGPLPFDMARLYFAETVLALEYLHSYGIVHRDLKPDNLLVSATGHIKLTDFGLSKIGLMSLTTNLCEGILNQEFSDKQVIGTPEYIAPEIILGEGYGKTVDWWSMGIILYEFSVGMPPFFGDTPEELFFQVINETDIEWPEEEEWAVRDDARDLITNLLQHNPLNRLGCGGAQEVKEHLFFNGLEWEGLLRKKPEFVPELEGDEDTSFFDTRVDRYNHDLETEDTEDGANAILFHSFTSCSPIYSKVFSKTEDEELQEVNQTITSLQGDGLFGEDVDAISRIWCNDGLQVSAETNVYGAYQSDIPGTVMENHVDLPKTSCTNLGLLRSHFSSEVDNACTEVDEPCTKSEKNDFTEANTKNQKSEKRPRRWKRWINSLRNIFACCVGLQRIQQTSDEPAYAAALADLSDWAADQGLSLYNRHIEGKDTLMNLLIHNEICYRVHSGIDQFTSGLNKVGSFLEAIRMAPSEFQSLFTKCEKKFTFSQLRNIYKVQYRQQGSNLRIKENNAIYCLEAFLADWEGGASGIGLEQVLSFWTGASSLPPLGFDKNLEVSFGAEKRLPSAHTCSLVLNICRGYADPDAFAADME